MDVTIITPSRPDRAPLLAEAAASVAAQTVPAVAHLVGVDLAGRGPTAIRNELLAAASTTWVAFLDDDDLLDPDHLETLLDAASDVDVVYPDCRYDGPPLLAKHRPGPYDRARLRRTGCFPITTLVRRSAIASVGGFPNTRWEDWRLWNRMADNGARFRFVARVTWTYRTAHTDRRTNA